MLASVNSGHHGSEAELLSLDRDRFDVGATRFLCCLDVSNLKRRLVASFSRSSGTEAYLWRYLVLGQACFHLGLMEDDVVLIQTGRRLATAVFQRESVCSSTTASEAESVS